MLNNLISYQCSRLVILLLMEGQEERPVIFWSLLLFHFNILFQHLTLQFQFFFDLKIWPDMTHMLKPWKIKALIGVVLFVMIYPCPPSTLKCNIWEGTLVSILTSMAHCGSSVTNVTHPSTSNVPLRNQKIVSGLNVLFVHFFVADNSKFELLGFISPPVHCLLIFHYVLCSFSLKKMGRNKICPDSESKESSTGGSAHKNKRLNQWPAGIQFLQILIWILWK